MTRGALLTGAAALAFIAAAGAAPGNGKLAYYRDGALYLAGENGSGETKVADGTPTYGSAAPLWAPDGAHVAYLAEQRRPGLIDVVPAVASADGSSHVLLAPSGSFELGCWLDSSTLVVVGDPAWSGKTPAPDLYAYGLDGSVRRLTASGVAKSVSPQGCAPDATAVAFAQERADSTPEARVVRLDGSWTTLTPAGVADSAPAWSPRGDALAFERYGGSTPGLYVSDPLGGGARRVTSRTAGRIRWSPDGRELLFTHSYPDYTRCFKGSCQTISEIWSVGANGSGERMFAAGKGSGMAEDWSPDGTRIAFSRGGRAFVMNRDGTCPLALPDNVSADFAWEPVLGAPPEPQLTCANLELTLDPSFAELPLRADAAFTATVTNQGNEPATGVVYDQPPVVGVALVSATASQGTCSAVGDALECQLGPLAVGASARVEVRMRPAGAMRALVRAVASAPETDGDVFDNAAGVNVVVYDCTLLGTIGADSLFGTRGRDHICGRFGNDMIYGNAGNDVIEGGEGTDTIYGGKGRDRIYGGGGNDVILARDGERDLIDCGPETDTAVVDRIDVVSHCRTVYRPAKKRHARAPR